MRAGANGGGEFQGYGHKALCKQDQGSPGLGIPRACPMHDLVWSEGSKVCGENASSFLDLPSDESPHVECKCLCLWGWYFTTMLHTGQDHTLADKHPCCNRHPSPNVREASVRGAFTCLLCSR